MTKSIKLKKDLPKMTVLEPFQDKPIEFETKEDFIEYINKDIEKYNEISTIKLNKMFIIPGYKVTKLKGVISLRAVKTLRETLLNDQDERLSNIEIEIDRLKHENEKIKDAFNQLSKQFSSLISDLQQQNQ